MLELVRLAQIEATQFEAIRALTAMPDLRALPAYLSGITSKNADLRKASRGAIIAIRDAAVSSLEELAERNELLPEAVTELQAIYARPVPVLDWRIAGPFPGHDSTMAFPPETVQDFSAWIEKRAAGDTGRLNLGLMFAKNQDAYAYGRAEFHSDSDRDARLVIGSDDTIVVWLNGVKVHTHDGDRAWNADADSVNVRVKQGKNTLLVKCGNNTGPWEFSVAVTANTMGYGFLKGGAAKFDLADFRDFGRKNGGDVKRGEKLFLDQKGLACAKCHAVGGEGGKVGPDLAGIGGKYNRDDLMTAILEPSKVIAQGYETVVILTKKGTQLTGVFKGETADAVRLTDNEGKEHAVPKSQIEEKSFSPVSTMPNGLSDGMTRQDFADLVAFLANSKEKKN